MLWSPPLVPINSRYKSVFRSSALQLQFLELFALEKCWTSPLSPEHESWWYMSNKTPRRALLWVTQPSSLNTADDYEYDARMSACLQMLSCSVMSVISSFNQYSLFFCSEHFITIFLVSCFLRNILSIRTQGIKDGGNKLLLKKMLQL